MFFDTLKEVILSMHKACLAYYKFHAEKRDTESILSAL
jgi:hypothetical protein